MRYLLDTGILIRLVVRHADQHERIRAAVRALKRAVHTTVSTPQNRAEFWNVCTRPGTARGGMGLTVGETARRLRAVERVTALLPDDVAAYGRWKDLVTANGVRGVQVHDARLVALMFVHGVTHILTLNAADFYRYAGIVVVTRDEVFQSGPPPAV